MKRLNFADMGLFVSCCRNKAYLSNAGVPQAALSAASSWLTGMAERGRETAKSKFAKRTWNVLWNQWNPKNGVGKGALKSPIPFHAGI